MSGNGWIGVDFDGTLAAYQPGNWKQFEFGEPIPAMAARIRGFLAEGREVRIVTARYDEKNPEVMVAIRDWTEKHFGKRLIVTDRKDYNMDLLFDDRALQVEANTGRLINPGYRGIE